LRNQQQNLAAIYLRLSRDDGTDTESNSIGNQRELLHKYAKEHGLVVKGEYVDDGVSGTTFEREGFRRMIADIEEGKIGTVLCKDLSRLGRNNALVAYYTEMFFPGNNVRFIALNDGIDSAKGDNEIMGFKSIINEWYARDISKKIRSSFQTMAQKGWFIGAHAPYGYRVDPDDHHHLLPDEATAPIVQEMFAMAAQGITPYKIQQHLIDRKIITPRAHIAQTTGKYLDALKKQHEWDLTTVTHILRNPEYCGYIISQKQTTQSFKDKRVVNLPEDEWVIAKNMHKELVDEQTFQLVQSFIKVKHRKNASTTENIFAGMVKCQTCGYGLSYNSPRQRVKTGTYMCNLYKQHNRFRTCSPHYITFDALVNGIYTQMRKITAFIAEHEGDLERFYNEFLLAGAELNSRANQKELEKQQQRARELDALIKRLFEQNTLGNLSDERFVLLSREYEAEQKALLEKSTLLQTALNREKDVLLGAGHFLRAIAKYKDSAELTPALLHELIEKIVVHEAEGTGKARTQKIDIYWRFVGLLPEN
jgi:DNA invertase Pin-like site-specific DNA recombinase